MFKQEYSLDDLHQYLQTYQIDAVLDRVHGEIRTKHFTLALEAAGTYTVTEKKLSGRELIGRVTAREITEKNKLKP